MMGGATPHWPDLLAIAQRAEAVGFDSLWVADHLLMRFPGRESEPIGAMECWSLLSAVAAATSKVELGPLVSCMNFRNPALLAKMAATVDEISDGRLILGLGAGWHEPEFRAFGSPYDHRVGRFEEAFTIVRTLLRTGQIDYAGTYYRARECELRPRGPRPSGPPLMVGTTGERMLRLTAQHADLWNVDWVNRPTELPPIRAAVDAACAEIGRDPATLGRTTAVMIDLPGQAHPSGSWVGPVREGAKPASGTPEELAMLLRAYAQQGISHLQIWLEPNTLAGVEAFAPVLELLDRESSE
jgi:alkanesulfonate monooxygenase SsuD/methylene tetrahydromethanopterin reductase-like flavin-dependent oxidoreductase (luciferase family)